VCSSDLRGSVVPAAVVSEQLVHRQVERQSRDQILAIDERSRKVLAEHGQGRSHRCRALAVATIIRLLASTLGGRPRTPPVTTWTIWHSRVPSCHASMTDRRD
jgi:hypothetical protein